MTRCWILRLAPAIVAALLGGIPRVATAAELGSSSGWARLAPTAELCVKAVFAHGESREPVRVSTTAAFTPPAQCRVWLHANVVQLSSPLLRVFAERRVSAPQPPARAPPPLS